ncbi:hypothetical protein Tco_0476226, partial [Tanacetum coccineum]
IDLFNFLKKDEAVIIVGRHSGSLINPFSLSGRVLSIRRTRLTPASLEMCIFLKDHLDAQERIQNISSLEADCLEVEEQLLDVEAKAGYTIKLSDE